MNNLKTQNDSKLDKQEENQKMQVERLTAQHNELIERLKADRDEQIKSLQEQIQHQKKNHDQLFNKHSRMCVEYENQVKDYESIVHGNEFEIEE